MRGKRRPTGFGQDLSERSPTDAGSKRLDLVYMRAERAVETV